MQIAVTNWVIGELMADRPSANCDALGHVLEGKHGARFPLCWKAGKANSHRDEPRWLWISSLTRNCLSPR